MRPACYRTCVGRSKTFVIWTPDYGKVTLDLAKDDDTRLAYFLQEVLDQGLWGQFRQFPPDLIARLKPRLVLAPARRRLVELWIEEGQRKKAA